MLAQDGVAPAMNIRPQSDGGVSDAAGDLTLLQRAALVELHVQEPTSKTARRIRLPAALSYVVDPIIVINEKGVIAAATPSIGRLLGWRADELVGKPISDLAPTLDLLRLPSLELGGGEARAAIRHNWQVMIRQRDGGEIPIGVSVGAEIPDDDGERLTCLVLHDLSERRQAERMLRLFRRLTVDLEEASSFEEATSMAIAEFCEAAGWDAGQVWMPDEAEQTLRPGPSHFRDALWTFRSALPTRSFRFGEGLPGVAYLFRANQWVPDVTVAGPELERCVVDALEFGYRTALGVPVVVGRDCAAVLTFYSRRQRLDEDQSIALAAMVSVQLASMVRRRRSERALLESERRFRETLNTLPLLGVILDEKARIAYCNEHFLDVAGQREGQLLGRSWVDSFVPEEHRDAMRARVDAAFQRGLVDPAEESEMLLPGGDRRLIDWRLTLTHDSAGEVVGLALVGMDITEERRRFEELQDYRNRLEDLVAERTAQLHRSNEKLRIAERLASIGTLAAGLGHDMNNMLLPIVCRIDALAHCDLDETAAAHVDAVRESVGYLQQLSDGLHMLNASPSKEDDRAAVTSLTEWACQAGALLRQASPKDATLEIDIPDNIPAVAVSPARITQAVVNLVSNAGDAVDDDGRIRVFAALDGDRFVHLCVQDNGRGMSEEERRHALDPFFTTKRRSMSTGLGLSLVHSVATSAGGDVIIDSSPGNGTTVTMLLPKALRDVKTTPNGRAHVAVRDGRIASVVESMLERARFQIVDTPREPLDLLVTDQRHDGPEPRRVIVIATDQSPSQDNPNTRRVDPTMGFGSIRKAVEEAAASLHEEDQ